MRKNSKWTLLVLTAALAWALPSMAQAETRKFAMNTVEIDGVKMWLPSTIVVKKGDEVEITATSKVGKNTTHGFSITDYKIVESPTDKGQGIKFKADKAGIFPIYCHLHPAHVGAQLVVLE
jgi:nitrosocyanin